MTLTFINDYLSSTRQESSSFFDISLHCHHARTKKRDSIANKTAYITVIIQEKPYPIGFTIRQTAGKAMLTMRR